MILFVLATTTSRNLLHSERIQHTLNVYGKIMQLEMWTQWVWTKVNSFKEGNIMVYQDFMNRAAIKYNKIIGFSDSGKIQGFITTVKKDIVGMIAQKTKKQKPFFKCWVWQR